MKSKATAIHRLAIRGFRGIKEFSWQPASGVNVILGGGDVGKTTVLDAIALLLSPTNPANVPDTDYHARDIASGFEIEAVISLPEHTGIHHQWKQAWPWEWNGSEAVVPSADAEGTVIAQPVYRLRVRGTEDLELVYEIVQPDGTADGLPVGLRRSVGLVRLGGDDRNDRDLRLVQGSALDRLLSDRALRSRMASELAKSEVKDHLTADAQEALKGLDKAFREQRLPDGLDLSITGGQGASIAALIGLTAVRDSVQLPLGSWGAGTRRLSALAIAEQNQGESPVTLVDEVERGLEPYRQRLLLQRLQAGASQVFITTHSPAAISAASDASLWYIDHTGKIGPLDAAKIARHRTTDPDTFLSRVAVIAEGATEVGFVSVLLEKAFASGLQLHGVHVSDGGGHDNTVFLLEALAEGGLSFGGFADDEGRHPTRWENLASALGPLLFRWKPGCIEDNIIGAVADEQLEALLADPQGEKTGERLRTLADRLNMSDKDFAAVRTKAGADIKSLVIQAALGKVPPDKTDNAKQYEAHARRWFKSVEGGRELAAKLFSFGLWPTFRAQLLPFCNAVRESVDLPEIADLDT